MKKQISIVILGVNALVASIAHAQSAADQYFSANPTLTPQEQAAVDLAKHWSTDNRNAPRPVAGRDGTVTFLYGASHPSIVCAPLQVCDVALQAGELVNSIHLGDAARWMVEPAISGSGATEVQHLIIKPMDVGLETSLVVTTNRRTYHLRLRSHRTAHIPSVAFTYPEDALAKWKNIQHRQQQQRKRGTIPTTGEYLGDLSFEYDVSGSAPWKPVRVYTDGRKTVIELPRAMAQTEAPALLVLRDGKTTAMVNYRVQGTRYIVDAVFDRAILIAGVGRHQDRVTITRKRKN